MRGVSRDVPQQKVSLENSRQAAKPPRKGSACNTAFQGGSVAGSRRE